MYIQTLHNRVRYTKHNKIDCRFMSMKLLKSQYTYKRIYRCLSIYIVFCITIYIQNSIKVFLKDRKYKRTA